MLYTLEQGPTERFILEQCYRQQLPLPAKIQNAPEVLSGLQLYLAAFWSLTSCRSLGYGEGQIPWTAIHTYCECHEILGEQREDLFFHVERLDNEYLKWRAKEQEKKSK